MPEKQDDVFVANMNTPAELVVREKQSEGAGLSCREIIPVTAVHGPLAGATTNTFLRMRA
jgi:hypothetical protein